MLEALQTAAHVGENVLEPFESAHIALGGRSLFDAQRLGSLATGQLFKVPEGEDFAVDGVKRIEGFLKPEHPFRPHRQSSRTSTMRRSRSRCRVKISLRAS